MENTGESQIAQARKVACRMQLARVDEDMRRLAEEGEEMEAMLLSQLETDLS
jgi:phage protein U